ncbi:bacterio-opsin activator domain-containing protein [Halorubrum persicum]|uniref:bacterio-opsin activator domain-containing protein n=1 Tax=Halorubrum persicum TaxID=1383844 RepID=UPI0015D4D55D|nr:bacterio-opsin activator domain-containing protein [Halorubrum persicum]
MVDDLTADDRAQLLEPLGLSADDQQISAGAIVPICYQDTVYGVLNVYTDREDLFDDREVSVLSELGDSIAHAIHSVETKKLILSDTVVELEFDIQDPDDVFVALSRETDSRIDLKGFVPAADGELISYLEVTGASTESFLDAATEFPAVQIVRGIGDSGDENLCELRIADSTIVLSLIEAGASVESMYAEAGHGHLTATVAPEVDVRTVVEAIETRFDDVDLVAKRETERDVQSVEDFRQSLENRLTDRQYSVLEAVYSAGYFDWPRESTAKEIANSLDVAPPTLHEHLRGAQKELIETFFAETGKFSEDERPQREE